MTNWWKIGVLIATGIGLAVGGFFFGRSTINVPEPEVKYIKGDTVSVVTEKLVPVNVVKPVDTANVILNALKSDKYYELFPERIKDSLIYVTKEDTSNVLIDWATERFYEEKLFDIDTVGTAIVKAKTQYNRLSWMETKFVPVTKVVNEVTPTRKFVPFMGAGITSYPTVAGQLGVFFEDKYGFSCLYQYGWEDKKNIWGGMFLYKF